ncbi:hypothetical protein B0H16DRAFT_1768545 [Mycena metata]|uniref:Uncharacterized protein n=1 Tax=Mycena metata TaxID=1033252 RepID=A0AAD7I227_9AGAR|nr:hypothetical protein B0H16DRAFT_1768545 [Mycena metata]
MNVDPPPAVPHPCDQNPNPKSLVKPETTFSVRHIKMSVLSIDANYPYTLSPIEGIFPNKGDSYAFIPVPYFEFCGLGAPPADVGTPGDVYIDTTPGAQALEFNKSCPSTLTPDEAKQALPELRRLVNDTKKGLLALKTQRARFKLQLAERQQACEALKAKRAK